ncbi:MAG: hypothetical protein ACM3ZR_04510, partial [Pseudomonadota bacterium]
MLYFCNVVSRTRIYQFLALYASMEKNCPGFRTFVLCMDDDTSRLLKQAGLEHAVPITLDELEDKILRKLKSTRKIGEYCWTLKPVLMSYVFEHYENIDWLTYLDADTYFFSDPSVIFSGMENFSVLLSDHDSNEQIKFVEKEVGRFNAGFVSFRNDFVGRECLHWWKKQCIKWCYNTTVTGQFGDQKYLEDMYKLFQGVSPVTIPGINVAPWNDAKYEIHLRDNTIYINDNPLILYHYCGFRLVDKASCVFMFGNVHRPVIHDPYMREIKAAISKTESIEPYFDGCF